MSFAGECKQCPYPVPPSPAKATNGTGQVLGGVNQDEGGGGGEYSTTTAVSPEAGAMTPML